MPLLDKASTRDFIGARTSGGGVPQPNPVQTVDATTMAALADYDHDLRPRKAPNKWMDPGDP